MFAEDVGRLPDNMFIPMLEYERKWPEGFAALAQNLLGMMSTGAPTITHPVGEGFNLCSVGMTGFCRFLHVVPKA